MKKRNFFLSLLLLSLIGILPYKSIAKKTQVLVIGTIHGSHESNPNYTFKDIVNMLGTFNPDVICVEIPPSYFRKRSYLKEMMIAATYGFENKKKVYPIDWTLKNDDRTERIKYRKTDDYLTQEKKIKKIVKTDSIMQEFHSKYGNWDNVWQNNNQAYDFYNGKECNNYIRQMYRASMAVYGDSFMNLHYKTRNDKMLELIESILSENKGKRIVILTGCEHKHYFDDVLSKRKNNSLIEFKNILPLKNTKISDNITNFIDKNLIKGYYNANDSSAIELMYQGALVPLIHGLYMDDKPQIIPTKNISKAKTITKEWSIQNPQSVYLQFEMAWIEFLEKDYKKAIQRLQSIAHLLDKIPQSDQWFVKTFFHRNLGFCYDLTGQREKAIQCYQKCRETCNTFKFSEQYTNNICKNYSTHPYIRDE